MIYGTTVTIPAQTLETAPVQAEFAIHPGRIDRCWVGFPPGCYGLAHVVLYHWPYQLVPGSLTQSLAWNNLVFDLPLAYDVGAEPYALTVIGWNDDDSYAHTITVLVSVAGETAPSSVRALFAADEAGRITVEV